MSKKDFLKKVKGIAEKLPAISGVNHARRIRQAYKDEELVGVAKYIKAVKDYVKQ